MHAVRRDDQVVGGPQPVHVGGFGAEAEPDAESGAALVQDLQQPAPSDGGEAVAAGGQQASAVHHVDVVPAYEFPAQGGVDDGVGAFDAAEGLVGEHDAEAEGVVRGVAFPHLHGVAPAGQQRGGVQSSGSAADDGDPQCAAVGHGVTCPSTPVAVSR